MTFEEVDAEQSFRTSSNVFAWTPWGHLKLHMESLEIECGVTTDSCCDIMASHVTFLYFWGTNGILLIHLWCSKHFEAYLYAKINK